MLTGQEAMRPLDPPAIPRPDVDERMDPRLGYMSLIAYYMYQALNSCFIIIQNNQMDFRK